MFLWCEKELIEGVLKIMEKINFHYVENFVFGVISAEKVADPMNQGSVAPEPEKQSKTTNKITNFFKKLDNPKPAKDQ